MQQSLSDSSNNTPLLSTIPLTCTRYIPLTDWPNHHLWPKIGGLRHLVFHSKSNGFESVIRRSGRRILIDEQAFFTWLDNQGGKTNG